MDDPVYPHGDFRLSGNVSHSPYKNTALAIYAAQLVVNFFWSIIFFNQKAYLFAFVWLILLWLLIVVMIVSFYHVSKLATYLQIPYLLWVTFAGYLNFVIYQLIPESYVAPNFIIDK